MSFAPESTWVLDSAVVQRRCVVILLVLTVLVIGAVWTQYRPAYISPDIAQLASTANNLIEGRGLKTSIPHYEEQLALGRSPVEQTIWPPGLVLLLAPLLWLGVSPLQATLLASIAGVVGSAFLVLGLCRALGLRPGTSLATSIATLLFTPLTALVLISMADTLYAAATLASALFLVRSASSPKPRLLTIFVGIAAVFAFLMRYAGVCWLAACGLFVLSLSYRLGWREMIVRALAYGLIPAVVVAGLFWRNYLVTGTLMGGPSVPDESSLGAVLRHVYYSATSLFGARSDPWQLLAAMLSAVAVAGIAGWFAARLHKHRHEAGADIKLQFVGLAMLYIALTFSMLFVMALKLYPGLPQPRYFAPLLPFLFVSGAVCCDALLQSPTVRRRPIARTALLALLTTVAAAYLAGQAVAFDVQRQIYAKNARVVFIDDVERERINGIPVEQFLRRHVNSDATLLTADGQSLAFLLDIPVIGLPEARYSRRLWTEDEVRALVGQHHVCYVLVHPPSLIYPEDRNRVFLFDLISGRVPAWLSEIGRTDRLQLYRVSDDRCATE